MKLKIKVTIFVIILLLLISIVGILLYFYTGNIASKIPSYIKEECKVKQEKYQNRSVFIIKPKEEKNNNKVIYYLHGGSYVAELSEAHWKFLSKLAQDTNSTLIVPDYPLTPQYNYNHTFSMVEPLYYEIASKVEKQNLILMGDSAGGGMALALAEKISQETKIKPSKTILISPWLDVSLENEKIKEVQEKDQMLNSDLLKLAGIAYSGSEEKTKEYLVSPIYGPLEKLENVIIYIGTNDILNPDVHILEQKAKQSNVNITVKETTNAVHDWLIVRYQDAKYDDELAKNAYEDLVEEVLEVNEFTFSVNVRKMSSSEDDLVAILENHIYAKVAQQKEKSAQKTEVEKDVKKIEKEETRVVTNVAKPPIEGKWFAVYPMLIDQSLFSEPRADRRQEETRQIILEAFAKMKDYSKYARPFKTLMPVKTWGERSVRELKDMIYHYHWGNHMADRIEQALVWAQRIDNGETWEDICNRSDTAKWYRLVIWESCYARVVGGSRRNYGIYPASDVSYGGYLPDYRLDNTVPLVVL